MSHSFVDQKVSDRGGVGYSLNFTVRDGFATSGLHLGVALLSVLVMVIHVRGSSGGADASATWMWSTSRSRSQKGDADAASRELHAIWTSVYGLRSSVPGPVIRLIGT